MPGGVAGVAGVTRPPYADPFLGIRGVELIMKSSFNIIRVG